MIECENFYEMVELCKLWAKVLRPYSSLNVGYDIDEKFNKYRMWNTVIDGYSVCLFYSEMEIQNNVVKSIQCFGKNVFSLPFHIVYKVCVGILGCEAMNIFFKFVKDGHHIYCWTQVVDENGECLPINEDEVDIKNYLGKKFAYLID